LTSPHSSPPPTAATRRQHPQSPQGRERSSENEPLDPTIAEAAGIEPFNQDNHARSPGDESKYKEAEHRGLRDGLSDLANRVSDKLHPFHVSLSKRTDPVEAPRPSPDRREIIREKQQPRRPDAVEYRPESVNDTLRPTDRAPKVHAKQTRPSRSPSRAMIDTEEDSSAVDRSTGMTDLAEKVKTKLRPSLSEATTSSSPITPSPAGRPRGLKIITESMTPRDKRPAQVREGEKEAMYLEVKDPAIHLPSASQNFLDGGRSDHDRDRDCHRDRSREVFRRAHHSTIVIPKRPAFVPEPSRQNPSRRRKSWSSDSRYSEDESIGTAESDEEAFELLAGADSGPAGDAPDDNEIQEERRDSEVTVAEVVPNEEEVKNAKDLLLQPEVRAAKVEDKALAKKRAMVGVDYA